MKKPVCMFWTAIEAVKAWFAGMVSKFFGLVNLDDGILACATMSPIGTGLHEPSLTCRPFVMVCPAQKLMLVKEKVRSARLTKHSADETTKGH